MIIATVFMLVTIIYSHFRWLYISSYTSIYLVIIKIVAKIIIIMIIWCKLQSNIKYKYEKLFSHNQCECLERLIYYLYSKMNENSYNFTK